MINVLFVCTGNICRSPTAEGIFRALVKEQKIEHKFNIDSAGTHSYHVGSPPNHLAMEVASERGINIDDLRARQIVVEDFSEFDYIVVMDRYNIDCLKEICSTKDMDKVTLLLDYIDDKKLTDVPDPYSGPETKFYEVFDLIQQATENFLDSVVAKDN